MEMLLYSSKQLQLVQQLLYILLFVILQQQLKFSRMQHSRLLLLTDTTAPVSRLAA